MVSHGSMFWAVTPEASPAALSPTQQSASPAATAIDPLSPSPALTESTIPGLPSPYLKRKRYAEETQDFINPEAGGPGTAPLQCTQGFVDPEAGGPGVAPPQCTQGFSTPPRRARTEMDFSPEAPSVSSAELRMGLQSLLPEEDKATEDPFYILYRNHTREP